eukprot:4524865-Heterocapsa_arctica.AAC.1
MRAARRARPSGGPQRRAARRPQAAGGRHPLWRPPARRRQPRPQFPCTPGRGRCPERSDCARELPGECPARPR